MARPAQFYERTFGFRVVSDFGGHGCAMATGESQVPMLFKQGGSRTGSAPHDGVGELHLAFAIPAGELERLETWLAENGMAV